MIDTAGTISKASDMLMEKGALSVRAVATHAVFSGQAYDRLAKSALKEIVVSDTIPLRPPKDADTSKITVLTVANMFADVIDRVYNYKSISPIFEF
ncbi:MAG TPA: ribose-phosphate pyrophosphokinase, partial [Candidatus Coprenecus stercoripullorum]|nr:ribose-phosphate pyrophosphokinase [Candidatus Coprenecus stercoripullorum]